ncbi:DUF995 domain-containing protein [Marimonas lutisalis]|uniref:DUF995 domain-containing protein n=1 Tax=Marimonas lutisalis TaxID=2545756 RepID=UPI0010FA3098|nr:DUF995 domain-containing protein [Marimonas lutisalis]
MTSLTARLIAAATLAALPALAQADPMPRGAKPASTGKIAQTYAGKTELWGEGCNGGIYFSPNWQARAWCADASESLGAGRWSVEEGQLCYDLTWHWPSGRRAGSTPGGKACIAHVTDRWGKLWRSWPTSEEWWPVDGADTIQRGYRFQQNVQQTQRALGL